MENTILIWQSPSCEPSGRVGSLISLSGVATTTSDPQRLKVPGLP